MRRQERRERPENSHDYRDGSDYIPFETITVIETTREQKPLLYDSHGTPLIKLQSKVGFRP